MSGDSPSLSSDLKTRFLGLVSRRERWGLSARGFVASFAALAIFGLFVFATVYPFLAVTSPVDTDVLVVEGWLDPGGFRAARDEINAKRYTRVFTTGGPCKGTGPYNSEFNTVAHAGYSTLLGLGVPQHILVKVPCRVRDWNRTYSAGLALREWFQQNNFHPHSLNILTESAHARRTRLLFQKALGPQINVGIISVPSDEYPPTRWWKYSQGVKDVLTEAIGYIYIRLFFWP